MIVGAKNDVLEMDFEIDELRLLSAQDTSVEEVKGTDVERCVRSWTRIHAGNPKTILRAEGLEHSIFTGSVFVEELGLS